MFFFSQNSPTIFVVVDALSNPVVDKQSDLNAMLTSINDNLGSLLEVTNLLVKKALGGQMLLVERVQLQPHH